MSHVADVAILDRGVSSSVPVPLLPGDGTVALEALLHRIYDEVGYSRHTSQYATRPDPPLSAEDQAWADDLLAKARITIR